MIFPLAAAITRILFYKEASAAFLVVYFYPQPALYYTSFILL